MIFVTEVPAQQWKTAHCRCRGSVYHTIHVEWHLLTL